MYKCYNFILRRIHVYYQAVLWIRGVIDYSVWICRNKINSDRIICGYLGFSNLLSKHNSRNENSSHFSDFSLPFHNKNDFQSADFWCQELLSCSCLGRILLTTHRSHICIKTAAAAAGGRWPEDAQGCVCGRGEVWGQGGDEVAILGQSLF